VFYLSLQLTDFILVNLKQGESKLDWIKAEKCYVQHKNVDAIKRRVFFLPIESGYTNKLLNASNEQVQYDDHTLRLSSVYN